ncbi:hypothetical protein [Phormidium sp. FACHB-1136]|uniref:hypothetical protein n=1 Tax=Phormidium sp. FACHB-1136 TaxID=2692848 RepID=UPI001687071F|nr:hypothetical protein [Phormidium sp. FACHB-1136]MBD2428119.1 hypothetical protein [Phormidium sp. FACHB-1136]
MQLDYSYQAPNQNPQSSPIPLDQYRNRPDRQEPGPVPRDLIPREWLENKRLPDVLAHGIVVMAAGPTGLCFLTALHYWMPRSKNIYDGKIWVYNTLEKWCGYTGLPIGTLRRTIDALVNAGIVETWRPNRRQPIRYTLNYPKLRELAKAELMKAGYWPNSECDQSGITESDQNDMTQTTESDQNDMTQTTESDQNGQTIQETNYSQENNHSQETTTRSGGGGEFDFEFLESEPREAKPDQGTGQAQVIQIETESTSLSSKKDQTGTTADRGSETYSSAAPSRFAPRQSHDETAQARILAQAEQKFGEALGIKNQFLGTEPAILALALDETKAAISAHQIQKSEMGHFISRIRHWLANPEEFQSHPDIRGRNRALASIAEFHEFFGWETEQTSPDWPGAGGLVAELDLRGAKRYLDWLIGRARGLVRDENLRIGEDPFELSRRFPQPRYTTLSMMVDAESYRNYLAWAATQPDYDSPEHMALIEEAELARQAVLAEMRAVKKRIYAAQSSRNPVATQRVEV